jgi:predicted nuclease of predicted toxin-antitoxin system
VDRTIRFHLDENCHRPIAEGLRRRGVDVTSTPEVGLLKSSDAQPIAHALPLERVIFTQDRDFLKLHAASVRHSGIAYCDKDKNGICEIVIY